VQVAELIGAKDPSVVEKHEKGFATPSPLLQDKYLEVSEGAVTGQDWLEQAREMRANPPQRPTKRPNYRRQRAAEALP
jgi:hypothetical protein